MAEVLSPETPAPRRRRGPLAEFLGRTGSAARSPRRSRRHRRRDWVGLAALLTLGSAWGLQITLMKALAVSPLGGAGGLAALLAMICALHGLGLCLLGGRYRPDRAQARFLLASAVTGFVVPLGAIMAAATLITSGLIVLIESLTPVAAILLVLALGAERVPPARAAAAVLGVAAAVVLLSGEAAGVPGAGATLGIAIAFVAPLSYAVNAVYVARNWPAGLSVRQAAAGEVTVAAGIVVPPILILEGGAILGAPPWAWGFAAGAAATGLVQGYLYFFLLRRGSAVFATFGSFVSLAAGVAWSMALLGESHPPAFWFVALLVTVALALAVSGHAPRRRRPRPGATALPAAAAAPAPGPGGVARPSPKFPVNHGD